MSQWYISALGQSNIQRFLRKGDDTTTGQQVFENTLQNSGLYDEVHTSNHAVGSSAVDGDAFLGLRPDRPDAVWWFPDNQTAGQAMLAAVAAIRSDINTLNIDVNAGDKVTILWSQGETAASSIRQGESDAATYKAATLAVFNYLRNELGDNVEFFLVGTGEYHAELTDRSDHFISTINVAHDQVQQAQRELISEHSFIHAAGTLHGYARGDALHFTDEAYEDIALASANHIINHESSTQQQETASTATQQTSAPSSSASSTDNTEQPSTTTTNEATGSIGDDILVGTASNDILTGGLGLDNLNGGAGDDVIYGGSGLVSAEDGADIIIGGHGLDSLYGNAGDDTIYGGTGLVSPDDVSNEFLHAGKGNDVLYGNGGDDTLFGGEGSDALYGGNDNDTLYGGWQIFDPTDTGDLLVGGGGNDVLYGNGGDDTLSAGDGNDQLHGGLGNDTYMFDFNSTGTDTVLQFENGGDKLLLVNNVAGADAQTILNLVSYDNGNAFFSFDALGSNLDIVIHDVAAGSLTVNDIGIL